MILVRDFKSWKSVSIIVALILMTLFFAIFMPKTDKQLNKELVIAMFENNSTKVQQALDAGANKNLILPKGQPLISIAIESGNMEILKLVYKDVKTIGEDYGDYNAIEHAISKNRKEILVFLLKKLEENR